MKWKIYGNKKYFYQWDINQKIILYDIPEHCTVDFAHHQDKDALVCSTYTDGDNILVNVPNILLQSNDTIYMYITETDEDMRQTIKTYSIGVIPREKPSDYIYKETEIVSVEKISNDIKLLDDKFTNMFSNGNLKDICIVSNIEDLELEMSKFIDNEGNVINLAENEYVLFMIADGIDGIEKGIVLISGNSEDLNNCYLTCDSYDLSKFATKEDITALKTSGEFKKIYDETITEEIGIFSYTFPKHLKEMLLIIKGVPSDKNTGLSPLTNIDIGTNIVSGLPSNPRQLSLTSAYGAFHSSKKNVNYLHCVSLGDCIEVKASYRRDDGTISRPLNGWENIIEGNIISGVWIDSNLNDAVLGVGTKIEIWGVVEI